MTIGERIKEARLKSGLTQKQLGEQCNLNVNSVSMYERNNIRPRVDVLERIAKVLNVQISWLLGFESDEEMESMSRLAESELRANLEQLEEYYGKGFADFLESYDKLNVAGRKMIFEHAKLLNKIHEYLK